MALSERYTGLSCLRGGSGRPLRAQVLGGIPSMGARDGL